MSNDPVKMVIVMRTMFPDGKGDWFGIRKGKAIAQAGHSVTGFLIEKLNLLEVQRCQFNRDLLSFFPSSFWGRVKLGLALIFGRKVHYPALCMDSTWNPLELEWLMTGTTKICVRAVSEEELLEVFQKAQEVNLPVHLVTDAGRTEFKEPQHTCLAIGPARSSDIDKITGKLQLL